MDCGSNYVIYLLEYPCGLQYVDRTDMTLRSRMNKHRHNVSKGFIKHSVSRHALTKHQCDFSKFRLTAIEQISEETALAFCKEGKCTGFSSLIP